MPHQNAGEVSQRNAHGDGEMKKVLSAFYYCIRSLFVQN